MLPRELIKEALSKQYYDITVKIARKPRVVSPCYQAHTDRYEGHGLAAKQVLSGVVLFRAEEAEVDADEHADAQQTAKESIIGPPEGQFLQLMAREK